MDTVHDAGVRLMTWLQSNTSMRYFFTCSLSCAFLGFLSSAIFALQERLSRGDNGEGCCTVERLDRFVEAFLTTTQAAVPCIKMFARHLPLIAEQLERLSAFAANLNIKI